MRQLLIIILFSILLPFTASAATLTFDEYYEFIDILNTELSQMKERQWRPVGNLVLDLINRTEKRPARFIEQIRGQIKLKAQYEARRAELYQKVKEQF